MSIRNCGTRWRAFQLEGVLDFNVKKTCNNEFNHHHEFSIQSPLPTKHTHTQFLFPN